MTQDPQAIRRRRAAVATAAIGLVLAVAVFAIAVLLAPTENASGQCSGIGWGCTLTPHDSLIFAGIFLGLPAGVLTLILTVIAATLLLRRTRLPGVAVGLLALVASALLSVVVVVGVLVLLF